MTVLFDLIATQPAVSYRFHGGAEYGKQIFFRAIDAGLTRFHAIYNPELELDPKVLEACQKNDIVMMPVQSQAGLEQVLTDGDYETFFSALPYPYAAVDTKGTRFVMSVHGLRNLEMPYDPNRKLLAVNPVRRYWNVLVEPGRIRSRRAVERVKMWELLSRAGAEIVTASRHSKYSIKSFFPALSLDQIRVIHCPVDDMSDVLPGVLPVGGLYYLLLGADRWIKNVRLACMVIDELISDGLLHVDKVLVLGAANPDKILSQLRNADHFDVRGYVERATLAEVYVNAHALIYPTLNEGFGYPPLNSMQSGTPVVASSVSSVPEVCGDAALYFNPCSPQELRNRILQIDRDEVFYRDLVAKGFSRFSVLMDMEKAMMAEMLSLIFAPDNRGGRGGDE